MPYEKLTPVDCALIGRSGYRELTPDRRTLVALADPANMQLILESAMDEPPNLEMIGLISAVCTRATVDHAPYASSQPFEYERLAGLANEFLSMVGENS